MVQRIYRKYFRTVIAILREILLNMVFTIFTFLTPFDPAVYGIIVFDASEVKNDDL
jgi:hypothetical protein